MIQNMLFLMNFTEFCLHVFMLYTVKINKKLDNKMKSKVNQTPNKTPIKNWQLWTPDDDLTILQSSQEKHENQLFSDLIEQTSNYKEQQVFEENIDQYDLDEYQSLQTPYSSVMSVQVVVMNIVSNANNHLNVTNDKKTNPIKVIDINRKGCTCKNSKCEKNYCDCFRLGLACEAGVCSCSSCQNTELKQIHQENLKRMLQIKNGISRGCKCKNSKCMKKYCECHSGGNKCSILCECIQCFNKDYVNQRDREIYFCRKIRKVEFQEMEKQNLPLSRI